MELEEALKRETSGQDLRVTLALLKVKESVLIRDLARKQFRDALAAYKKGGESSRTARGSWRPSTSASSSANTST